MEIKTHPVFLESLKHLKNGESLIDLGCYCGDYALGFKEWGCNPVVGIEARQNNFIECLPKIQPGLTFYKDDVLNIAKYDKFDVSFCCGLLYHLQDPLKFLKQLESQTNRLIILDTHYAEGDYFADKLSAPTEHEGLNGRWYTEYPDAETYREECFYASWGNQKSFWLSRGELLNLGYREIPIPSRGAEKQRGYFLKELLA